jgi:hypothetical protein
MSKMNALRLLAIGVLCAINVAASAQHEDDNSRAVRIIEEPGPAAPAPVPPPATQAPPPVAAPGAPMHAPGVLAAPSLPAPVPGAVAPPALLAPPPVAPAPLPSVTAAPPVGAPLRIPPKAENSAGVSLEILPGPEVTVGAKVTFRVASKRPGYLVLVDVDAAGKVTQIFPNRGSLLRVGGRDNLNRLKPGRAMTIPEVGNAYAGFEFVASPPTGIAMVVAILSDRPVQMLDLPDVPAEAAGQPAALNYISEATRGLRIASADDARGGLQEAQWSFDAKLYLVK